jgi:hypothetical protein
VIDEIVNSMPYHFGYAQFSHWNLECGRQTSLSRWIWNPSAVFCPLLVPTKKINGMNRNKGFLFT